MTKVALAMIIKGTGDEPARLRRALQSVAPFVDGIFITLTGPKDEMGEAEKVCQEFKAVISYTQALYDVPKEEVEWLQKFFGYEPFTKTGDKIFLFDEARNFNFAQVTPDYDYIFWLDCDDILRGGENMVHLKELAVSHKIEAFYLNYIYQADFDAEGNIRHIVIEHLRERFVRRGDLFKWIAPIHETLIEQRPTEKTDYDRMDVLHLASLDDRAHSLQRNMRNLEHAVYATKGKDPRHVYYLAKAYFDLAKPSDYDKALPLIEQYLYGEDKSGWPEERAQACEYLAEIYRIKQDYAKAIKSGMSALIEQPESPTIYINIAISYMLAEQWERALFWIKLGSSVSQKKTTLVSTPRDIQARTMEVIYQCCVRLAKIDQAWGAAHKLLEMFPDTDYTRNNFAFIDDLRQKRDATKYVVHLANFLKQTNQWEKIKPLLAAIPNELRENPFMVELYQKNNPPKYWEEKDVAIYCGPGFTTWSPQKMDNPGDSFVGGSEEAVVCMSRELAKLGWKVTVYGDPSEDEGTVEGVNWLPYWKFNGLDHFNILVVWRQIGFFDQQFHAKKAYIWNHDIQNSLEWNKERTDKITKAFFLSKWHRDNVLNLAEEKVMITSNGL